MTGFLVVHEVEAQTVFDRPGVEQVDLRFFRSHGESFAGIVGGLTVGVTVLDLPMAAYCSRTVEVLDSVTFLLGVIKSMAFAVLITLAGCYCGFRSSADAQGVGRAATSAVVSSIFLVVIADAVIAILYSFIGY